MHGGWTHVLIMSVMLSPLSKIRPSALRVFFLIDNSSASSSTRFMYSSKPMMRPSILRSVFSKSQTWMRVFCEFSERGGSEESPCGGQHSGTGESSTAAQKAALGGGSAIGSVRTFWRNLKIRFCVHRQAEAHKRPQ